MCLLANLNEVRGWACTGSCSTFGANPTGAAAYKLLRELRWRDKLVCSHCGEAGITISERSGYGRKTRSGSTSQRCVGTRED